MLELILLFVCVFSVPFFCLAMAYPAGPPSRDWVQWTMERNGFCTCEMCLGAEMKHGIGKKK